MASAEMFKKVEEEYSRLKGKLGTGQITREQFESSMQNLAFQYESRYWNIGPNTGQWHVYTGKEWVPAEPPSPISKEDSSKPTEIPKRVAPQQLRKILPDDNAATSTHGPQVPTYAAEKTEHPATTKKAIAGFFGNLIAIAVLILGLEFLFAVVTAISRKSSAAQIVQFVVAPLVAIVVLIFIAGWMAQD
jgi:hypothetical protein